MCASPYTRPALVTTQRAILSYTQRSSRGAGAGLVAALQGRLLLVAAGPEGSAPKR
jgi:hypothetical protein